MMSRVEKGVVRVDWVIEHVQDWHWGRQEIRVIYFGRDNVMVSLGSRPLLSLSFHVALAILLA